MKEHRQAPRYLIFVQRLCSMGIISFKDLAWYDHTARIVNISKDGVGIESQNPIEPGFIFFRDRVGGYKGGVVIWSRRDGAYFRGGARFVPLGRDEEQCLQKYSALAHPDAEHCLEQLMESLIRSLSSEDQVRQCHS